jgi:hypothetical protein
LLLRFYPVEIYQFIEKISVYLIMAANLRTLFPC